MKTRFSHLYLLVLLLALAACGEVPTSREGAVAYPLPPTTQTAGVSTPVVTPVRDTHPPMVIVDIPIFSSRCTPTPGESERAAVVAQDLPTNIDFELQRAIYLSRQQGIPGRPARVIIRYDPGVLTLAAAAALAQQHGVQVQYQSERNTDLNGVAPLDILPGLAAERGVTDIRLEGEGPGSPPCSTPGGPTPIPVTRLPGHPL